MVRIQSIFCPMLMKGFCITAVHPKMMTAIPMMNPISGSAIKPIMEGTPIMFLMCMLVILQYPMRQVAVADQLDRAGVFLVQPFGGNIRSGMVMEGLVDASDVLDHAEHGANVVRDQDNGALTVDLFQQLVEMGFEPLVDV